MSVYRTPSGDRFEYGCDMIDVTSLHRPDISWAITDANGHVHRWHTKGQPATDYSPSETYDTPTLVWVKDGEEYWDGDDEPHDVGHLECKACGAHVEPGYTADAFVQHVPGLRWCRINGEPVTPEEFQSRWEAERA